MSYLEVALVVAVLLGAGAGTALVVRNPSFWAGLLGAAWSAAIPHVVRYVTKPMTPADTKRYQQCVRRGGEWDPRTKTCK